MKKLTANKPKCLVELHSKSLLDWQLSSLRASGINDISIVTGYKRELLQGFGLVEFYNSRWASSNMVTSLECADEWLKSEPCIVSYSDIFYRPQAVKSLMESLADLAVTYDPDWLELWELRFSDPLIDAETFRIDESGYILEIGNKPVHLDEIQGQYMGLLRITPSGWYEIQRIRQTCNSNEQDFMHMTGLLQQVIENGNIKVLAIPYNNEWGEIDSAEDLAAYHVKK